MSHNFTFYQNLIKVNRLLGNSGSFLAQPYTPPAQLPESVPVPSPVPVPEIELPPLEIFEVVQLTDDEDDDVIVATPPPPVPEYFRAGPKYYRIVDNVIAAEEDGLTPPIRKLEGGFLSNIEPITEDEEVIVSVQLLNKLINEYNDMRSITNNLKPTLPITKRPSILRSNSVPSTPIITQEDISDYSDDEEKFEKFSFSPDSFDPIEDSDEY